MPSFRALVNRLLAGKRFFKGILFDGDGLFILDFLSRPQ